MDCEGDGRGLIANSFACETFPARLMVLKSIWLSPSPGQPNGEVLGRILSLDNSWSGIFLPPALYLRRKAFDSMRLEGSVVVIEKMFGLDILCEITIFRISTTTH